jgi:hypothetical protein
MAWFELLKDVKSTITETLLREGIQAIPEMFSGGGVTVELKDKMGIKFPDMDVGDVGIIIANIEGHLFDIGEEVTVRVVDINDDSYKMFNEDGEEYWVYSPSEVKPKVPRKNIVPTGNIAIITFNILEYPFKMEVEITDIASLTKLSSEVALAKDAIKLFAELVKMDADRQNKFPEYVPMQIEIWNHKIQLTWENGTGIMYDSSDSQWRFMLKDKDSNVTSWGNAREITGQYMRSDRLLDRITSSIQKSWIDILKIKEEEKEIGLRSKAFKEEQISSLTRLNYYHWKKPDTLRIVSFTSGLMMAKIRYDGVKWFNIIWLGPGEVADEKSQIMIDNLKALSDANIEGSFFSNGNRINIEYGDSTLRINVRGERKERIKSLQVKNISQSIINFGRFLNELNFTLEKWGDEVDIRFSHGVIKLDFGWIKLIDTSIKRVLARLGINLTTGEITDQSGNVIFNLIQGNFEKLEEWKENFIKVNERGYEFAEGVIQLNSDIITWTENTSFELGPTPLGRIYIVDMEKFKGDNMCIYPKGHSGHYCIETLPNSPLPFGDHLGSLIMTLSNDDKEQMRAEIRPMGGAPEGGWLISDEVNNTIEEIISVRKEYFDVVSKSLEHVTVSPEYSESNVEAWIENFDIMLQEMDWALADYEKELVAEKRQLEEVHELFERLGELEGAEEKSHDDILRIHGLGQVINNHNPEDGLASENKVSI